MNRVYRSVSDCIEGLCMVLGERVSLAATSDVIYRFFRPISVVSMVTKGHFRVRLSLYFKTSLSAKVL